MNSRNEKTSARVARIAAKVMAAEVVTGTAVPGTGVTWSDIRALAASALTQTADKQPDGFDPREGGELEGRWRPKSKQVRLALRGKLGKK